MATKQKGIQEENEIDLVEIICKLWAKRKFIIKVTAIFACLGVFVALFSAKEYTASCTIVPQSGEASGVSASLGGLAAMAGINLSGSGSSQVLSPNIYPNILASIPFQKELMQTPIKFEEYEHPIRLIDFYTKDEYKKLSLMESIMKYTIGLPEVIIGAIRGEEPELKSANQNPSIQTLTKDESDFMEDLKNMVSMDLNDKDGYVSLAAVMPEPLAAAQLVSNMQNMLQTYVTKFKIEKAQGQLDFVEGRYLEAEKRLDTIQEKLAIFKDANRSNASAVSMIAESKLSHAFQMASGVYSELAKQRETAKIQVKEDTPIFTIVEPVAVPNERSKPKRGLICITFTFLGGIISAGLVLVLPFLAQISGNKRLANWLPETITE